MNANSPHAIPRPELIEAQIAALEDELRALRRLLRASRAAHKAAEARERRHALAVTAEGAEFARA
jgi:hypothetical protein